MRDFCEFYFVFLCYHIFERDGITKSKVKCFLEIDQIFLGKSITIKNINLLQKVVEILFFNPLEFTYASLSPLLGRGKGEAFPVSFEDMG